MVPLLIPPSLLPYWFFLHLTFLSFPSSLVHFCPLFLVLSFFRFSPSSLPQLSYMLFNLILCFCVFLLPRTHVGCTKEFNRPDKLKAHILSHSGERTMAQIFNQKRDDVLIVNHPPVPIQSVSRVYLTEQIYMKISEQTDQFKYWRLPRCRNIAVG